MNHQTIISGNTNLVSEAVSPASTVKIVIGWAALEEKIAVPETKHLCNDKHIIGTPRELSMKEAMFLSSNDYFLWLSEKIGIERLTKYIDQSRFFSEAVPSNWYDQDPKSVIHGGHLKVTPRQEHAFIQRIMNGEVTSTPDIQKKLLECLEWPSINPEIQLYGKTGSYGVYWFNGFGKSKDGWKAVTVLMTGDDKNASRDAAIEIFYKRWNLDKPNL
jgi:beta-lactamase class D